ncbi:MAG: helix-hairpin-helix domain-containing protein, partial [Bacteroidota bacterium]
WSWINGIQLKNEKGSYSGTIELPAQPAKYQFRYLVDGNQWINDPSAEGYLPNVHGTTNCLFELEGQPAPIKKAAPKKKMTAKKASAKKVVAKKKDDLKKIEGIGPKIAGLLNEAGIETYSQLSKASLKKLQGVLKAAGPRFRLAKPDTWKAQAKLAAAGQDTELKKLQDEFKVGIKK